jgi:fructose-1,6-bisphosphatase/inositol monophosphatase family enzyme
VTEAGGSVTNMDSTPFGSRCGHVLATNRALHDQMLTVIREFRAGRAPKRTSH